MSSEDEYENDHENINDASVDEMTRLYENRCLQCPNVGVQNL